MKTKELVFDLDKFIINASETNFNGGSITHNGTPIDDTHTHAQGADSVGNTQQDTETPK